MSAARPEAPPVPRQLVVVATARVPTDAVEAIVRTHCGEGVEVQVHLIASTWRTSWLNWSTTVEGPASAEAAQRAGQAADAISSGSDSHGGDIDPLQAVEDALRLYVADELVVVTASDEETSWTDSDLDEWAREKFGLPIKHLVARSRKRGGNSVA
jgi:hypothetical protein